MRSLIMVALLMFIAATADADPFLVCDPQAGVTQYKILTTTGEVLVPAESDGSVHWDIAALANGVHPMEIYAGAAYTLNGVIQPAMKWSNPVPFDLGVPVVGTPVGIGLNPN